MILRVNTTFSCHCPLLRAKWVLSIRTRIPSRKLLTVSSVLHHNGKPTSCEKDMLDPRTETKHTDQRHNTVSTHKARRTPVTGSQHRYLPSRREPVGSARQQSSYYFKLPSSRTRYYPDQPFVHSMNAAAIGALSSVGAELRCVPVLRTENSTFTPSPIKVDE